MPINWGGVRGVLGDAAKGVWGSRIGKGAIGGAGVGGLYGLFSDNSSFFGGAARGAVTGGLLGGAKGWGLAAGIAGGVGALAMGSSPMWGVGAGMGGVGAGRYARGLWGRGAGDVYRMGRTAAGGMPMASRYLSLKAAGRRAYHLAYRDARASARFIGQTAQNAPNSFRAIKSRVWT